MPPASRQLLLPFARRAAGAALQGLGGWACLLCDKTFKSKQAARSHERSAEHREKERLATIRERLPIADAEPPEQAALEDVESDDCVIVAVKKGGVELSGQAGRPSSSAGAASSSSAVAALPELAPVVSAVRAVPLTTARKRPFNRGAERRRRHTWIFMAEALEFYNALRKDEHLRAVEARSVVAKEYNVPDRTLYSWVSMGDLVHKRAAAQLLLKLKGKSRRTRGFGTTKTPWHEFEHKMSEHVKMLESKRIPVHVKPLETYGRVMLGKLEACGCPLMLKPGVPFVCSKWYVRGLLHRLGMGWLRIKNRRQSTGAALLYAMRRWVTLQRAVLSTTFPQIRSTSTKCLSTSTCRRPTLGACVALGLLLGGSAWQHCSSSWPWSCTRPIRCQSPYSIGIILRGTGQRIAQTEILQFAKGIHAHWQPKAWADQLYTLAFLHDVLLPWINEARAELPAGSPWILMWDSLHSQRTWKAHYAVTSNGGCVIHGPKGMTEAWQPIDRGLGALVKQVASDQQMLWLERPRDDNPAELNWTKWQAAGGLATGEKRVLLTHWAADAWHIINTSPRYRRVRQAVWQHSGSAATAADASVALIKVPQIRETGVTWEPVPLEECYIRD